MKNVHRPFVEDLKLDLQLINTFYTKDEQITIKNELINLLKQDLK